MSVLKNKRTVSSMQFYVNAIRIRKCITFLLLKDFGINDKVRNISLMTEGMEDEDRKDFEEIANKYGIHKFTANYPEWFINNERDNMLVICRDLIWNIVEANSIYVTNESEYYERRNIQNRAIGNCEQLLQEMQYVISIIPCDLNKFQKYTDMIEEELALLKGWRKSGNKILKRIKGEESNG